MDHSIIHSPTTTASIGEGFCAAWRGRARAWRGWRHQACSSPRRCRASARPPTRAWRRETSSSRRSATVTSASRRTPTRTSSRRCRRRSAGFRHCPSRRTFLIHTGDLTHLSKPEEFDTLQQVLLSAEGRPGVLRARRARHARRRRPAVPGSIRQGHEGPRLVQLRPQGRPLHRARQRRGPQGRRPRQPRRRAARVARTAT